MSAELDQEQELASARLDRATARRLGALAKPVARWLCLLALIHVILATSIVIRPWFLSQVIDHGRERAGDSMWIASLMLGLGATWLVRFGGGGFAQWLAGAIALRVLGDLRACLHDHVLNLSVSYFDRTRAGRIVARIDRDVESLEPALVNLVPELLGTLLRCIAAGVIIYCIDPTLLIYLFPLLPMLLVSMVLFKRLGSAMWGRVAEFKSRVTAHLCETITGVRVIQQCAAEKTNSDRYVKLLKDLDGSAMAASWAWGWFAPFTFALNIFGICALIVVGGQHLAEGQLTLGQIAQCIFYVFLFLGPLQELGELYERSATAAAAAQRVFLLLDTKAQVVDQQGARPLPWVQGSVDFHAVRFSYVAGREVLHGIDLHIQAGETVALVGPTGHGKSTLVQLLCRFYDPDSGCVSIDGHDLRSVSMDSLRRQVSVVLQDNVLFSGSIRDNLRLAKPEASEAELDEAVVALGADEILLRLPQGLNTSVGPAGSGISLGQRQLVCLVRAFLANPRVLVLDEATSSIDLHTEGRLQRALRRLCKGRTSIIVAHRLATIRHAHRIVVIQDGKIAEQGNHEQLIVAGGVYAGLYKAATEAAGES